MFGSRVMGEPIPRYDLPDGELPPQAAYQLIHDEMTLDGPEPRFHHLSFTTEQSRILERGAYKRLMQCAGGHELR